MNWKRILIGKWSWKRPFQSLIAIYVLLCAFAVSCADRMIFLPPAASYGAELPGLVRFKTDADENIAAAYFPARAGMPTLLYSHGNAEDAGQSLDLCELFHAQGLGVLAYDYPGYGLSTGRPTEKSSDRSIAAAWKYLRDAGVPAESIVIVTRSVGGGPGVWLASRKKAAGLVLIAPFTSAFRVAIPFPLLPGDRFKNLKLIRSIHTPLLVIHGENDEVIPVSHGRKLVAASPAADKKFVPIPGAGHNDIFLVAGDEIVRDIANFARRVTHAPRP